MGSQIALGALDMKTFVALLALCVAAAVAQDPCGGTFGSNTYSLDNLNTGTGADYEADAGIYKYTIGVCEALVGADCTAANTQCCQAWPPFGMEMVPNIDFWRAFPGYVASGFKY